MKYHVTFLTLFLTLIGFFSYLALALNSGNLALPLEPKEDFGRIISSFRENHQPITEINFTALYSGSGQFQILHPLLNVRKLDFQLPSRACGAGVPATDTKRNQAGNEASCRSSRESGESLDFESIDPKFPSQRQEKFQVLEHFLNDAGGSLPSDFLINGPFVDGFGYSYALHLAMKGPYPYNQKAWVEQHLSYFRVSELKDILRKFAIDYPAFAVISHLTELEIEDVIRGSKLVLSKDYLLVKNQSHLAFSPLSYWVYDAHELSSDLKGGKYELVTDTSGSYCIEHEGNACWTYNSKHALAYLHQYSLSILILVGFLLLVFLALYLKFLYEKSRENQRHRLALQVLSHEFRTPVSAMLLLLNRLDTSQSNLSIIDQDTITRISTEIFRLQRIIEISKTYLQAESRRIPFKFVEIPSINTWISDFVAESDKKIRLYILGDDLCVNADPFWLKFVLSSLVQNAFAHGSPPVSIRITSGRSQTLRITVEDQGDCEFSKLNDMTSAFVKSSRSKGMGLGLNIIKFVIDEWGGELLFANSPTSFTVSISAERMVSK